MIERPEKLYERTLPLYGVECFGTALVDPGSFARASGLAPAPALVQYRDEAWFVTEHWASLLRYRLAAQAPAWIMQYLKHTQARVAKRIKSAQTVGSTEILVHELCDIYGALAVPVCVGELLFHITEERVRSMLTHVGVSPTDHAQWLALFAYPKQETAVMRERRAFLDMAAFARTHSLDRASRSKISRYLKEYGALGRLSPLGRPFAFKDFMARAAQLEGEPKDVSLRETRGRVGVSRRVEGFMDNTGLQAVDRDAIRALQESATWRLRGRELWVELEEFQESIGKEIAKRTKFPEHLLWHLRPVELSALIHDPASTPSVEDVETRRKKHLEVTFVEHMVHVSWT
ncbi:hypothetical protein HYW18_03560 [Candidatus Uhrbacteria bacterium]|nr:hypothetical protein [Candidatus Uhrbacteria bacterium]